MDIEQANSWFVGHQLLVTTILMPVLSGLAAFFSSRYSTKRALKSAIDQRQYDATNLISQFRQNWINELRSDVSEHQAICLASRLPLNSDGIAKDKGYRLAELSNRILLRLNPADPDYSAFASALAAERARIHDDNISPPRTLDIAQKVLKREWERLKADLRKDALAGW